jgi:hypothetical protein
MIGGSSEPRFSTFPTESRLKERRREIQRRLCPFLRSTRMAPRVCLSSMSTTSWLARVRPAGGRIHPPLLALHIVYEGFHRIRYYGFLGNRHRKEKLEQCRHALGTVWLEENRFVRESRTRFIATATRLLGVLPSGNAPSATAGA